MRNGSINLGDMPNWARAELRLDDVISSTLQWFDVGFGSAESCWNSVEAQRWSWNGSNCILMRALTPGLFPCKFVADMADGLNAAAAAFALQPTCDPQKLFTSCFPGLRVDVVDDFVIAAVLWSDISVPKRETYRQAGRSDAGLWAKVIENEQITVNMPVQ